MGRGAWQATVQWITRVRHDLVTKPSNHASFLCAKVLIVAFTHLFVCSSNNPERLPRWC